MSLEMTFEEANQNVPVEKKDIHSRINEKYERRIQKVIHSTLSLLTKEPLPGWNYSFLGSGSKVVIHIFWYVSSRTRTLRQENILVTASLECRESYFSSRAVQWV